MINYLIIGLVFAGFIEYTKDRIKTKWPSLMPEAFDFGIGERGMLILLWPFCLFVFCYAFYKSYYNFK